VLQQTADFKGISFKPNVVLEYDLDLAATQYQIMTLWSGVNSIVVTILILFVLAVTYTLWKFKNSYCIKFITGAAQSAIQIFPVKEDELQKGSLRKQEQNCYLPYSQYEVRGEHNTWGDLPDQAVAAQPSAEPGREV
jgi:hypothetical protein